MKAAIYARVSTEEQTLGQQVDPLKRHCEREGWEYEVFSDKVSGSKDTRPGLDIMMQAVRNQEFQIVMVLKLDRLGRSVKHLLQLIEEFDNKDVKFVCLDPNVDTGSPMGRFFILIIGAVAEFERELIRERTKLKMKYLREQGVRLGRPPGAKDKKPRRTAGYNVYWAKRNQKNRRR